MLRATYFAFVVYLLLPLAIMIAMGFKDGNFVGFPIERWTTRWYAAAIGNSEIAFATGYSLALAVTSSVAAIVVGLWIALFLSALSGFWRAVFFALVCLPAVIPGIISAISMRIFIRTIQLDPGFVAIALGHAIHSVPFVVIVVLARLGVMPRSQVEAAQDLGADPIVVLFRVTLPFLAPSIMGGSILCMLLSFDDFVRTYFLGGYEPTLPVLIFAKLRSGMSPEINAISTLVLLCSAIVGIWAERMTRRSHRQKPGADR